VSEAVNTAAFFDLDKTIIAKSSVLAFGRSFYREGLLSRRSIAKSVYAQVMFMLVGADAQKMEKLRVAMSAMTRGWNRDQVASIVRDALTDVIEPIIYAEALELFDEHHAAGRKVVIVSSAPLEVVQPLSEFLGADEAIGTQAAIDSEGNYTGELEFYAYGDYKAQAVRELAWLERVVLLLQAIGEFKYREISEIIQVPIGTVMSTLSRCRLRLRQN